MVNNRNYTKTDNNAIISLERISLILQIKLLYCIFIAIFDAIFINFEDDKSGNFLRGDKSFER